MGNSGGDGNKEELDLEWEEPSVEGLEQKPKEVRPLAC